MSKTKRKPIWDWKNEKLNRMSDILITLLFVIIVLIMVMGTINILYDFIVKPKTQPTDLRFMMVPYLGIPFAFWLFVGIGIVMHGFALVDGRTNVSTIVERREVK